MERDTNWRAKEEISLDRSVDSLPIVTENMEPMWTDVHREVDKIETRDVLCRMLWFS